MTEKIRLPTWPDFVDDVTKTFRSVFSGLQFLLLSTHKMQTLTFTRQYRDIIQVRWKTFTLLYGKSIEDYTCYSLSESARFCGRYDKKHFGAFFFRFTV